MRFGQTLRAAVYPPFKDHYIDYAKLKSLLREDQPDDDNDEWTAEDEQRFCDEIFNVQLDKVARFQQDTVDALRERLETTFDKLKELAPPTADDDDAAEGTDKGKQPDTGDAATVPVDAAKLKGLEKELDSITQEITELKKFSSVNYTGFLKIVKKHDRKRGDRYRVRPMMQLSLSQRPFNSEKGYAPLLNKLSIMYFAIRQHLEEPTDQQQPSLDLETPGETLNGETYTAHRFWVHPDNLLEVKTLILRHLPMLVYSDQTNKAGADGNEAPSVTSVYLDNKKFKLYSEKVARKSEASTVRLRWHGQLSGKPEVQVEQKTVDGNKSEEARFNIKDKYVKAFLDGEYGLEKSVAKMERQGLPVGDIEAFKATVQRIQAFVRGEKLSPVLRANYVRTAFQKPTDSRVRVLIDTDLAFIREDTLDAHRPCRNPADWHRGDVDNSNMTYPFSNLNQGDVSRFPYAVLELRVREDPSTRAATGATGGAAGQQQQQPRRFPGWVEDLMSSHLVHPVPRFSKFVQGVASLFDDYVNDLPFWLSDLETDIRKDPQEAFEAEEKRRSQRADDVMAVGSLIGAKSGSYKAGKSSPIAQSYLSERMAADARRQSQQQVAASYSRTPGRATGGPIEEEQGESSSSAAAAGQQQQRGAYGYGALSSVIPSFSLSKYARAKRERQQQQGSGAGELPEGVVEPTTWIKNAGELKIEPKVWLANERTFLKWQHICVLLGSLAVAMYTAAAGGHGRASAIAEAMSVVYIFIAAFAGLWGYYMLQTRRAMIMERSGKHFDNMVGPLVVSGALMVALVMNLVLQYSAASERWKKEAGAQPSAGAFDELRV